jgi:signal transduction histidine kinase
VTEPARASWFAEFPNRAARWLSFVVVAGVVGAGVGWRLGNLAIGLLVPAAAVAIAATLVLLWTEPGLLLAPATVATAGVAIVGHGSSATIAWFATCMFASWIALTGRRAEWMSYWACVSVLFVAEGVWVEPDTGWGAWIGGVAFAALGSRLIRHEVDLLTQLRAAQAGLAERAMAEERNRIARELHDVIAHTMTVSLLHVGSARLAVQHDPADAVRALAEAERLGRESLAEIRAAVGLLREGGGPSGASPLPNAAQLPELIEQSRLAGADIEFRARGELSAVPATAGLAAYRITQEALTNAMKHAPGSSVVVEVSVEAGACRLLIDSKGAPVHGRGAGLTTMRERAESVGGTLSAGPAGAGWQVCATLPIREATS